MNTVESCDLTGAERVVKKLESLGVTKAFGLPGVHNLALWRALRTSGIELIGVRHEQTTAYAADGYHRASGLLAVALVTTGPGAANTVAAVGEAMASGSAMMVIATDVPTRLKIKGTSRGVLHESRDQQSMFTNVTKAALTVERTDQIAAAIASLATAAMRAPRGPVYLGIPTDLLDQPCSALAPAPRSEAAHEPDRRLIDEAASVLTSARSPLIWCGGGAVAADAGEVIGEIALKLGAPVVTTFASRGILPPSHPCTVAAPIHDPAIGRLWDEADAVLAVGSSFDGMMTQNWAMPQPTYLVCINADEDDATRNYKADLMLTGDVRAIGSHLLGCLTDTHPVNPQALIGPAVSTAREFVSADEPEAKRMLQVFERTLSPETVVVADMCIPGYWLAGYGQFSKPRRLAYPVGWGTLGFALPAAIGSTVAAGRPTLAVCGDGGFLFACGELATIAEQELPLVVVLVDDGGYGMLRYDQISHGDDPYGVDLVRPDFVRLTEAFGVASRAFDGFDASFESALNEALAAGRPSVLVVRAKLKPPITTSARWYRRTTSEQTAPS